MQENLKQHSQGTSRKTENNMHGPVAIGIAIYDIHLLLIWFAVACFCHWAPMGIETRMQQLFLVS
jgi:hypothetical protein